MLPTRCAPGPLDGNANTTYKESVIFYFFFCWFFGFFLADQVTLREGCCLRAGSVFLWEIRPAVSPFLAPFPPLRSPRAVPAGGCCGGSRPAPGPSPLKHLEFKASFQSCLSAFQNKSVSRTKRGSQPAFGASWCSVCHSFKQICPAWIGSGWKASTEMRGHRGELLW